MKYNRNNFSLCTRARFKGCKRPRRPPDYISYTEIDGERFVSSEYWYTEDYVIRCSDHWSYIYGLEEPTAIECRKVGSCYWTLRDYKKGNREKSHLCGKCRWKNFRLI